MPAAPITFDLTGSVPDAYSMSFNQGGLSLTVSSALYDGTDDGTGLVYEYSTPTLSMTSQGIGALNTYRDLEAQFDGDGKHELATFSFQQSVTLVSVKLTPIGTRYNPDATDTRFVLFRDGLLRDVSTKQIIDTSDFTNDVSVTGTLIGIGAVYHVDGFRIAAITVIPSIMVPGLQSVADAYAIRSSAAPLTLNVLANDTEARQITGIDTSSAIGSVTLAADGLSLVYAAGLAYDDLAKGAQATDTFTYTVLGTDGMSQTQTVTMTITGDPNEINGTAANNTVTGTERHDIIQGLAGNDTLSGMGGNDEVFGGAGYDRVYGNDGNDRVDGGEGNDTVYGGAGNDTVAGGIGNDYVYGDAGNDSVVGGDGSDRLYGGDGDDTIDGSIGTDRLYGDAGNDVLTGSDLANILDGGTGADAMTGGAGNDIYYVDDVGDVVTELALNGNDLVYSTVGLTLGANVENLVLIGTGAVNAFGNEVSNRLTGNAANNVLSGLLGNDRLDGGLGDDRLVGGSGRDILTGGAGADEFVFAEWGARDFDTVTDFNAVDDSVLLSGAAMGHAAGGLTAAEFGFAGSNGFGGTTFATTSAQRIIYDQARGDLYFDADGNGSGAKQLIASFVDGTVLTIADIFVF